MTQATIYELGNGLPDEGDYVAGDDGELYRIIKLGGQIRTNGPGQGNSISAELELADWDDCTDESEPTCRAVLESIGEERDSDREREADYRHDVQRDRDIEDAH